MVSDPLRDRLNELFTYTDAMDAGMSRRRLYAMRDEGELTALGGGLYRWADAPPADLDLIEIAERAPRATLCLETALARHDLIDSIPASIDVAIPRGRTRPRLKAQHRLHHFAPDAFEIGRESIDVGARTLLGLYSPERSIIDMIRLRHDQGPEQAWEALRRWLDRPGRKPADLVDMASHFHGAEPALRSALEMML